MEDAETSEPYYRVQNQVSCDDSIEDLDESVGDTTNSCKCRCNSKISDTNVKILTVVAVSALLLSMASVSMVTVQWIIMPRDVSTTKVRCDCPSTLIEHREGYAAIETEPISTSQSDDSFNLVTESSHASDDVVDVDCPTCRVRRDGQRRASNGRGRNRRRKCNRECHGGASMNQTSVTAIHFQGYPPGVYHLGQEGAYVWWRPATWYSHMTGFHYNHTSGHVTVRKTGLYYIYSQMVHTGQNDQSYAIIINDEEFIKCTQSTPLVDRSAIYESSCHTGGATFLHKHDRIWIKGIHTSGQVTVQKESTFWGLIRLGSFYGI